VDITTSKATIELQTFYFPGWRVWLDGKEVKIDPSRDPLLGRMQIDVTSGRHLVTARFTNTSIRTFGNLFSLISWLILLGCLIPGQSVYNSRHVFTRSKVSSYNDKS
jgi:hypothetical protein